MEVPGVSNANFLRAAMQARMPQGEELDAVTFYKTLYAKMDQLGMSREIHLRAVNEGFSGGEKKRNEVLQMLLLDPLYAILDETDSGLDIDALRIVSEGVNSMRSPFRSFLVITHYKRLLDYIKPDVVHVLADGRIVRTGGGELVDELESRGYEFPERGGRSGKGVTPPIRQSIMSDTPDMSEDGNKQNLFDFDRSKGNFSFPERHKFNAGYGLTEATIDYICDVKDDPEWVRQFRKNALAVFESKPMPTHWASPDIEKIDFSQIRYYLSDGERPEAKLGRRAGRRKAHL